MSAEIYIQRCFRTEYSLSRQQQILHSLELQIATLSLFNSPQATKSIPRLKMHPSHFLAAMFTIFSTAIVATPVSSGMTVEQGNAQCAGDQTIACCNSANLDTGDDLLGLGLNQLLGGNCQQLQDPGTLCSPFRILNIITRVNPLTTPTALSVLLNSARACGSNIAACCQKDSQTVSFDLHNLCDNF